MEEKVIIVKQHELWKEHFKKHLVRSLILYGFGLISFGFVISLFVIGMIIGVPLIIIGSLMMIAGIIGAIFKLMGKLHVSNNVTDKTKRFGLLFPKFIRSKELREKYG